MKDPNKYVPLALGFIKHISRSAYGYKIPGVTTIHTEVQCKKFLQSQIFQDVCDGCKLEAGYVERKAKEWCEKRGLV